MMIENETAADRAGAEQDLIATARAIRSWQDKMRGAHPAKYSDVKFCAAHPQLGSSKTYHLILDGRLAELDAERWLVSYRGVLATIEASGEAVVELEYEDLTTVQRLGVALPDAMKETGMNRLIVIEGPSGSGKSTAARMAQVRFGAGRIVIAHAVDTWKDSNAAMLRGILSAMGAGDLPAGAAALFDMAVARLRSARICLVIDEAHHLGPRTLNIIKSLINATPGEFVLLAMGTLWRNLERACYEEARQLTQNRLLERIIYCGATASDVALIFERRLGVTGELAAKAAHVVRDAVARHGHLGFVKLICREARRLAGADIPDLETIVRAATRVAATR